MQFTKPTSFDDVCERSFNLMGFFVFVALGLLVIVLGSILATLLAFAENIDLKTFWVVHLGYFFFLWIYPTKKEYLDTTRWLWLAVRVGSTRAYEMD